jgi:hypothetical protein
MARGRESRPSTAGGAPSQRVHQSASASAPTVGRRVSGTTPSCRKRAASDGLIDNQKGAGHHHHRIPRAEQGSLSASTPTARCMWPAPSTSWADGRPRPRLRYRALLAWARSLGEVTAWGVEEPAAMGPPWPGFLTARVRWCWRWTGLTAPPAGGEASPIRWTPRRRLGRCWPARRPPSPRRATTPLSWCGVCGWPGPQRSRLAPRPPTPCGRCW